MDELPRRSPMISNREEMYEHLRSQGEKRGLAETLLEYTSPEYVHADVFDPYLASAWHTFVELYADLRARIRDPSTFPSSVRKPPMRGRYPVSIPGPDPSLVREQTIRGASEWSLPEMATTLDVSCVTEHPGEEGALVVWMRQAVDVDGQGPANYLLPVVIEASEPQDRILAEAVRVRIRFDRGYGRPEPEPTAPVPPPPGLLFRNEIWARNMDVGAAQLALDFTDSEWAALLQGALFVGVLCAQRMADFLGDASFVARFLQAEAQWRKFMAEGAAENLRRLEESS